MFQRWLLPQTYHSAVLFFAMGVFGALTAWISFSLIHVAMENIRFLRMFGGVAIMEGGLTQLAEIIAYGLLSLAFYLCFKVCEVELVARWRARASQPQTPSTIR
ncbi:MAG: hypothetical protein KDK75_03810 [Alphaproteobacteria bacterium]|nr:hypothetical protein [Alphaproteobacteria bacterium]